MRAPTVFRQRKAGPKKILRRLTRGETASQALGTIVPGEDIFGFTKGQFSLLELLAIINDQHGPFHLTVSTWTAANAELDHAFAFLEASKLLSARFILDFTFQRRQPAIAQKIRETFGAHNIRVTRNHAKFALLWNDRHKLTVKTSMNLNVNPRFENFELNWDPDLFAFLEAIADELFEDVADQASMPPAELQKQFDEAVQ